MDRTKPLITVEDLVFKQTHCDTCGKAGREDTFTTCTVCGVKWCDGCARTYSHSCKE